MFNGWRDARERARESECDMWKYKETLLPSTLCEVKQWRDLVFMYVWVFNRVESQRRRAHFAHSTIHFILDRTSDESGRKLHCSSRLTEWIYSNNSRENCREKILENFFRIRKEISNNKSENCREINDSVKGIFDTPEQENMRKAWGKYAMWLRIWDGFLMLRGSKLFPFFITKLDEK